jgi:very-short-patch-repair endonuclease
MVINDNKESVTCRICGEQCKRIYGRHLKHSHDNMSTDEYKRLFPGAPITTLSDKEKTSKNSGLHMKDEKYKKMFSEMFKGDKNPNHISNTTDEQRRSRSPFSKSFVGYDMIEDKEEHISKFAKDAIKNRVSDTTLRYYLDRGYTEEVAKQMLSERQTTFSLEKCIEKYGVEVGYSRWCERQKKWLNSYKRVNYSKISQELFISVYNELKKLGFVDKVYFAKLNENNEIHNTSNNYEFRLKLNNSYILPDFFIPNLKLILEFDGTYYHRDTPENKLREENRNKNIIDSGYSVIHISEKEYNENKEFTILRVVNQILKIKQLISV